MQVKFIIAAVFVLLGTNAITFYATRELAVARVSEAVRSGHRAILRDLGFTEREQVLVSGVDLEHRLTQTFVTAGGIPSARWNAAIGSLWLPIMLVVTGVLLPFVHSQRRGLTTRSSEQAGR